MHDPLVEIVQLRACRIWVVFDDAVGVAGFSRPLPTSNRVRLAESQLVLPSYFALVLAGNSGTPKQ